MELSHLHNTSFPVLFFPLHPPGVGHWAERGTLLLHAPQKQLMSGERRLLHSPLLAASPEVEWVFTLGKPRVLTLLLTSIAVSMSLSLCPGSTLSPCFVFSLQIPHSCPLWVSLCLSLCLCLFPSMLSFWTPLAIVIASKTFNWLPVTPLLLSVNSFLLCLFNFLSTLMPWPELQFGLHSFLLLFICCCFFFRSFERLYASRPCFLFIYSLCCCFVFFLISCHLTLISFHLTFYSHLHPERRVFRSCYAKKRTPVLTSLLKIKK